MACSSVVRLPAGAVRSFSRVRSAAETVAEPLIAQVEQVTRLQHLQPKVLQVDQAQITAVFQAVAVAARLPSAQMPTTQHQQTAELAQVVRLVVHQ